tara:strand:- start:2464 stop:2685 length:222 start_codon:yes stop_codon:yes gene_type:complete
MQKAKKVKKAEVVKEVAKTTETFGVHNVVRVRTEGGRHWEKKLAGNIEVDLSGLNEKDQQKVREALEKTLGDI